MTPGEFQAASCALLRSTVGWQTRIAARLGIEPRTVRRWWAAQAIPDWVDARMAEMMGGHAPGPWPRDEWIVGDGVGEDGSAREYVVHTAPPRFIARVVALGDKGLVVAEEAPADIFSGTIYEIDYMTVLAEIEWIDTPRPGEVTALLEAAADAIARQADQLDSDTKP